MVGNEAGLSLTIWWYCVMRWSWQDDDPFADLRASYSDSGSDDVETIREEPRMLSR